MTEQKTSFVTKVVLNGRITIPEAVRTLKGIKEGDFVKVSVEKVDDQEAS